MIRLILLLTFTTISFSQVTLYTPNGKSFQTYNADWQYQNYDSSWFNTYRNYCFGPGKAYPNSEIIGEWEDNIWEYNCHAFAWNNWQGVDRWDDEGDMWKFGKPSPTDLYWLDDPYVFYSDYDNPVEIVSYIETMNPYEAALCTYEKNGSVTHSARIIGDGTRFISKWGSDPIIKHPPDETPLDQNQEKSYGNVATYYKINPAYRPVGEGDIVGRNWQTINNAYNGIPTEESMIYVLSGNHTLSASICIPNGMTIKINAAANVNLNGFYIMSTGGDIIVEDWSSVNCCYVIDGYVIGLYSTISQAIQNSGSNSTIRIQTPTTLTQDYVYSDRCFQVISSLSLNNHILSGRNGIILTGSVSGCNAYLRDSSGELVGLYPNATIAVAGAMDYDHIQLFPQTYDENISITSKAGLHLYSIGNVYTLINGNISVINCNSITQINNIHISDYHSINVSNSSIDLYGIKFSNTTSNGLYLYNSTINMSYVNFEQEQGQGPACWLYNVGSASIDNCHFFDQFTAVYAEQNSFVEAVSDNWFCGNEMDIYAVSGSWGESIGNKLSASPPQSVYGDIYIQNCTVCASYSAPKTNNSMIAQSDYRFRSNDKNNPINTLDRQLYMLMMEIINDNKKGINNSLSFYKDQFMDLASGYESIVSNETDSTIIKRALSRISLCYLKSDCSNQFMVKLQTLSEKNESSVWQQTLERYSALCYIKKNDFNKAYQIYNRLISLKIDDEDLWCEVYYELGMLLKYHLERTDDAKAIFEKLINSHSKHSLSYYAMNELQNIKQNNKAELSGENHESVNKKAKDSSCLDYSAYPNPFNQIMTIRYRLPESGSVRITVYDITGRRVSILIDVIQSAGEYTVQWHGYDDHNNNVPSGIYFYRIETDAETITQKIVFLK